MSAKLLAIVLAFLICAEWHIATHLPWRTKMPLRQRVGILGMDLVRFTSVIGLCYYVGGAT